MTTEHLIFAYISSYKDYVLKLTSIMNDKVYTQTFNNCFVRSATSIYKELCWPLLKINFRNTKIMAVTKLP